MIVAYSIAVNVGSEYTDLQDKLRACIQSTCEKYNILDISEMHIVAPMGATHYAGDIHNNPTWYKCTQIGVVGDHWWRYTYNNDVEQWRLYGHVQPPNITKI